MCHGLSRATTVWWWREWGDVFVLRVSTLCGRSGGEATYGPPLLEHLGHLDTGYTISWSSDAFEIVWFTSRLWYATCLACCNGGQSWESRRWTVLLVSFLCTLKTYILTSSTADSFCGKCFFYIIPEFRECTLKINNNSIYYKLFKAFHRTKQSFIIWRQSKRFKISIWLCKWFYYVKKIFAAFLFRNII